MTVRDKIIKRIVIRTIIMLLVAAVFVSIYIAYYTTPEKSKFGVFAIPFFALIYAVIIYKSKLLQMLFDKDWEGKVIKSDLILDWEPITFAVAVSRFPMKQIFYTVVMVEKPNGDIFKFKVPVEKLSYRIFAPDDIVRHYKGTKYLQNLSKCDQVFICPVCGRTLDDSKCPDCHVNFAATPKYYDPYNEWWNNPK